MKHANEGFTLIELMIVIAVVGILTVVTVPNYQSLRDQYRLESSANHVLLRLRHAQQIAMDERKNIGVELTQDQVQLVGVNPENGQLIPLEEAQTFETGVEFARTSSTALWTNSSNPSGQGYLYFDYRGFLKTNPAGVAGTIALESNRIARQVQVKLEAGTGNMMISWP